MNFSYAPAAPIVAATNTASSVQGIFLSIWPILLVIVIVFVGLVVYYSTIGYKIDMGWEQLFKMFRKREDIDIEIGIENDKRTNHHIEIKPDEGEPPKPDLPPVKDRASGMPGSVMEPSFFESLNPANLIPNGHEVYNVSRNIYTYHDAAAVCAAMGGEVASYDQVKEAYERGADWCNYGWVKGQMAVFPTQKETYQKLQKGSPNYHNACGRPGVNGGYFDNPELLFGVNCIGKRPAQKSADELRENDISFPQTAEEIEFDKKVQKFREQLDTTNVLPFNKHSWSA